MLKGIHFLLTYMCNSECEHCFVYSSPKAKGTFTLRQIKEIISEAAKIGTVEWIHFEGGEPFLFYPLMLEGIKIARSMGFKVGVVTNAYFATSMEDAELWLRPLLELGISDLSISDDLFHFDEEQDNLAKRAVVCARRLGMPVDSICIERPTIEKPVADKQGKEAPVIGGGVMFRGRAVEKLIEDLPGRPWHEYTECPHENLKEPERVHLDAYGYVHICQGLCMGNAWETPLSELAKKHDPLSHPICGPLIRGGPAALAKDFNIARDAEYVDACHFCHVLRLALIDRFPQYLAPRQVYGLG
ncbi:radical SAM protein [candidate division WOR-3 bacterium]|nr:radical SAM protein [candidate division WOR-3 bacterium]